MVIFVQVFSLYQPDFVIAVEQFEWSIVRVAIEHIILGAQASVLNESLEKLVQIINAPPLLLFLLYL